jgi:hypothetical protein
MTARNVAGLGSHHRPLLPPSRTVERRHLFHLFLIANVRLLDASISSSTQSFDTSTYPSLPQRDYPTNRRIRLFLVAIRRKASQFGADWDQTSHARTRAWPGRGADQKRDRIGTMVIMRVQLPKAPCDHNTHARAPFILSPTQSWL